MITQCELCQYPFAKTVTDRIYCPCCMTVKQGAKISRTTMHPDYYTFGVDVEPEKMQMTLRRGMTTSRLQIYRDKYPPVRGDKCRKCGNEYYFEMHKVSQCTHCGYQKKQRS